MVSQRFCHTFSGEPKNRSGFVFYVVMCFMTLSFDPPFCFIPSSNLIANVISDTIDQIHQYKFTTIELSENFHQYWIWCALYCRQAFVTSICFFSRPTLNVKFLRYWCANCKNQCFNIYFSRKILLCAESACKTHRTL